MITKEELIFAHYEADLQLIHDKLVQMISEVNTLFKGFDKLKKNVQTTPASRKHRK